MALSKGESDEFKEYTEKKALFCIARAHWIQLFKVNMQQTIIAQTFINIAESYPHLKPYWTFMNTSRPFDTVDMDDLCDSESLDEDIRKVVESGTLQDSFNYININTKVSNDHKFGNHIATVQAAITIIMDNVDDYKGLIKIIREFGSYHFFYEAFEPHFYLFHTQFMIVLKSLLKDTLEEVDDKIEDSWNALFDELTNNMSYGVALQRHCYLKTAFTLDDMMVVEDDWYKIEQYGFNKMGDLIYDKMLVKYVMLIKSTNFDVPVSIENEYEKFLVISHKLVYALQTTIKNYSYEDGFADLPEQVIEFTNNYTSVTSYPMLFRKAFCDALISALTVIIGNDSMKESKIHIWGKLYRILEQAIMTNIANV
uniref:GLOBIN domain-containing protein n=1 Tax=Parastrongyloides trichosuri TaxID=131310 RepID=A0A0N4ZDQ5_PARTI